jgi:hypothetical protein
MQHTIGQGPGNLVPDTEKKKFLANGTITKGEIVGFYGATGYTVDQANATTIIGIGVADETVTDDWFDVITSGFCTVLTNDGTNVVAYDFLVSDSSGKAIPYTLLEAETDTGHVGFQNQIIGQALQADTGTNCAACIIWKRI